MFEKGIAYNPGGLTKAGTKKPAKILLSKAYESILAERASEELKEKLKLPDDATIAYAIAKQVAMRALGEVHEEAICFKAITELRETTEGKTPDKIIAAGTNSELAALAQIMKGDPALPDSDSSEDTEEAFHEDHSHELE